MTKARMRILNIADGGEGSLEYINVIGGNQSTIIQHIKQLDNTDGQFYRFLCVISLFTDRKSALSNIIDKNFEEFRARVL